MLGFNQAVGGDEVFRHLVLAPIIEPTSKLDSLRVLVLTGTQSRTRAVIVRLAGGRVAGGSR